MMNLRDRHQDEDKAGAEKEYLDGHTDITRPTSYSQEETRRRVVEYAVSKERNLASGGASIKRRLGPAILTFTLILSETDKASCALQEARWFT
jgi:hypothetical protein